MNSRSHRRQKSNCRFFLRTVIMCVSAMMYMLPSAALSQEPSKQSFNNACRTCHSTREGDNRLGPSLHGILGRKAGSLPGYAFSSAMKNADFVWDEGKLDRFMARPDEVVPNNRMKPYGGLASADERAKIIAFLRSTASRP